MDTRRLGRQGLQVSPIGYGSMGTAWGYGPSDDEQSVRAIRRAHELGVTHFDTAELYGWGDGERLLGKALAPIRSEVTIATKFGFKRVDGGYGLGADSRPEHIREVVDNSLRLLGIDVIDLLYQHAPDPDVPVEDVVGVMKELVEAGKVRFLGLSNTGPDDIRRAHRIHPISVLQHEYSIFAHDIESTLPVLEELGIGLVAYSPLARGFLSGRVRPREDYDDTDMRHHLAWWKPENFEANLRMVDQLTALARAKGITLAQLALAWLLARRDYIVPIPGSRSATRVAENVAAAQVSLTETDLARIDEIAPNGGQGGRLN